MPAERRGVSGFDGQRLEQARTNKDLSRCHLATAAGVSVAHAQAVADQPAEIPLLLEGRLREQLAAHFDMTPDALRDLAIHLSNDPEGNLP
ncbi:hypothetical protein ABZ313_42315 [Streptomyces sp. NPDC006251]|uniref:hypothetical protein n=1 Tax=Streptomyces sp. NPDC006251 TaxID=3155718 RepID=UPI0033A55F2C